MPFNLIYEKWIPVRRKSGKRQDWIAPWQIADMDDPPIALDAVRPDFNGALIQFLIGLVQTAFAPKDDGIWRKYLRQSPKLEELKNVFKAVDYAFTLDTERFRFMQDPGELPTGKKVEDKSYEIEMLLPTMPQKQTKEHNRDHFAKRNQVKALCPACAAVALYNVQSCAPGGGSGHYSSLRGAGPITTVIAGSRLWETVWLNVLTEDKFLSETYGDKKKADYGDKLPWMSEVNRKPRKPLEVRPPQANPALMFWGMPWRIWLQMSETAAMCGVCGRSSNTSVAYFIKENNGTDYHDWIHVLSPFRETNQSKRKKQGKSKEDAVECVGTKQAGTCYRYWLGLAFADKRARGQHVAPVVSTFFDRAKWADMHTELRHVAPRLWAFGYEFKKAEAACWHEGHFPVLAVEPSLQPGYEACVVRLVQTADVARAILVANVLRAALEDRKKSKERNHNVPSNFWELSPDDAEGHAEEIRWQYDKSVGPAVEVAESRFWKETERNFYEVLDRCRQSLERGENLDAYKLDWLGTLRKAALAIFDDVAQTAQIADANAKRVAMARRNLENSLKPDSKSLRRILGL